MDSENSHGCTQNAENDFGFNFLLERYHKYGNEFLNHIVRVTSDETWVSFVNVEIKKPSKQWMLTHSQNKPKKFKQILSACQTADGRREGVFTAEFMQQWTTITSEVYCETLKNCVGSFRTKFMEC
jgi:predicted nuclease of restriction endonuclease-like RecB superfamily